MQREDRISIWPDGYNGLGHRPCDVTVGVVLLAVVIEQEVDDLGLLDTADCPIFYFHYNRPTVVVFTMVPKTT